MASISSGGQPWKVDKVSVSETRVVKGRSRRWRQASGISARRRSIDLARVHHALEEGADLGGADAGEIVADAHVEHRFPQTGAKARGLQHLDQHRALDIFLQRLVDGQLLRPFDVEADRSHVDARPRHFDVVLHLNGLALDDAAARQPGQHDVLRHLGVRAGGRAERGRRAAPVKGDGKVAPGIALNEALRRQIEGRPLPLQFAEQSVDQNAEGKGNQLNHGAAPSREITRE